MSAIPFDGPYSRVPAPRFPRGKGRSGSTVGCAGCGATGKTLLKREGGYVCRDCYAYVLRYRTLHPEEEENVRGT